MELSYFVVDAFANRPFAGNPAAVVPLEAWLPDSVMQSIAAEMNLSETAFFLRGEGVMPLRWFTPAVEVELCGHATLASAFVLMTELEPARTSARFSTKSGVLGVDRTGATYALDLPAWQSKKIEASPELVAALGATPDEVVRARDVVAVFRSAEDVRALAPKMDRVAALADVFAVCVTARGSGADADVDFVSRFFAPAKGVAEDPVTGSAHCALVPYWAARLGKTSLKARQVSARTGELTCELRGERVSVGGAGVLVAKGKLLI